MYISKTRAVTLAAALALVVPGAASTSAASAASAASVEVPAHVAAAPSARGSVATDAASGTFTTLGPARLLDTRIGKGAARGRLGPGRALTLKVGGRGGVPATGVSAVVVNLTGVAPTAATYLTAYAAGDARPGVSNLNLGRGAVRANYATVPVSSTGSITIYNHSGSVDLVLDVLGFYNAEGSGRPPATEYLPVSRVRLFDSRTVRALDAHESFSQSVDFEDPDVPETMGDNDRVRALVLNLTAVSPQRAGSLVVWSGAGSPPGTSTVNFAAGLTIPNLVVTPTIFDGGEPSYTVTNNSSGRTHFVVDLVGAYLQSDPGGDLRFKAVPPQRIVDTRSGLGISGPLGPRAVKVGEAPSPVDPVNDYVLAANATAVAPTAATYLTLWADGEDRPNPGSDVNAFAGQTSANGAMVPISESGRFDVYNNSGSTHVVLDISGVFEFVPPAAAGAARRTADAKVLTGPRTAGASASSAVYHR